MSDLSGLNLQQPPQIDWDNYNPGSKYQAPPDAVGPDGKALVYYGQAPKDFEFRATQDGFLEAVIDPVKIVKSGNGADGYEIRFTSASVKPFEKNGKALNVSKLGNYLRSCGVVAKPQQNEEYAAAVRATAARVFPFTLDWEARNKETGEVVRGYANFPDDPDRPGKKKAILHAGDVVTERDNKGNITGTRTITSDVLFANARVRYFVDPSKQAK